jgi:hypothetical protein
MYNLYVSWGIALPLITSHFDIDDNNIVDLRNKKRKLFKQGLPATLESLNATPDVKNFFVSRKLASATNMFDFLKVVKSLPLPLRINFITFNDDSFLIDLRKEHYQEQQLDMHFDNVNIRNNPLYAILGIIPNSNITLDENINNFSVEQNSAFEEFSTMFTKSEFVKLNDHLKLTYIDT